MRLRSFFVLPDAINAERPGDCTHSPPDAKRARPRAIELRYPSNSQQRHTVALPDRLEPQSITRCVYCSRVSRLQQDSLASQFSFSAQEAH